MLLNILLNFLHNSIKKSMNFKLCMHGGTEGHIKKLVIDNHNAWTKFFSKDYSYIIDKFYSQQLSITSCTECVYYTSNHEPLMNFQLEIPDGASTLYDCLDSYTRVSKLEVNNTWTCDKCKKSINPDRKLLLWNCPSVIIILLKRYTIVGKNNTYIEYPLELDVNGYVVNYNKNNCEYRLSGLCIQSGSLGGGHYYALCKNYLDDFFFEPLFLSLGAAGVWARRRRRRRRLRCLWCPDPSPPSARTLFLRMWSPHE